MSLLGQAKFLDCWFPEHPRFKENRNRWSFPFGVYPLVISHSYWCYWKWPFTVSLFHSRWPFSSIVHSLLNLPEGKPSFSYGFPMVFPYSYVNLSEGNSLAQKSDCKDVQPSAEPRILVLRQEIAPWIWVNHDDLSQRLSTHSWWWM